MTLLSWIKDGFIITNNTVFDLSQDLVQISFTEINIILDFGWYPDLDIKGVFRTVQIKDMDWEYPLFSIESKI